MDLNTEMLNFEEKSLFTPLLEDVKKVLQKDLLMNFEDVSVDIVKCPDLRQSPFSLSAPGLGGSPVLIEIGGAPYLLPIVDRSKIYNLKEICKKSFNFQPKNIFAIGAGAGPYMLKNSNCEGIYNLHISANDELNNASRIALVEGINEDCVSYNIPSSEPRLCILGNIFACEGQTGDVLKIVCKQRIGSQNFIESIRIALTKEFVNHCIGLGGVFLLKSGYAYQHVMRDFSDTPIYTEESLNNWLRFYNMPAPLNATGTLVTNEYDLDLRLQHFHSFSPSNWAGHYHYDTTPDIVEYEGYFNFGEKIIRVDRPLVTHKFGRD